MGMVLAQDPSAANKSLLTETARPLVLPQFPEGGGEADG
jgi:hypothetical protein